MSWLSSFIKRYLLSGCQERLRQLRERRATEAYLKEMKKEEEHERRGAKSKKLLY